MSWERKNWKKTGVKLYELCADNSGSHTDIWPLTAQLWWNVLLKTHDYCLAKYSKAALIVPYKRGRYLKILILVWAKLPKWLFHVDGSHAGLSPHYYHIQLIQRGNNTVINGSHHYFYFHKQSKVSLGKYMRVHLTFDWHVYFSWPICFFRTLVCGLFINLLFPGRRYFKVPLPILLAASPLACQPHH